MAEGVAERHARSCKSRDGGRCNCKPSYQVTVYDALRAGTLRASDGRTVRQVAERWIEEARSGLVRNRSGDVYKPSAIRSYDSSLRRRVFPALGERKFSQVRRVDVQDLVDELHKDGLNASTVLCSRSFS